MHHDNNATRIRRELMVKLASAQAEGRLGESLDRLAVEMRPRTFRGQRVRCCIHTERAILKYRLMALLGFCVEDEADELKPLSAYAQEAQGREARDPRLLTVIDEACSACVQGTYFVSNACRGCMAQPCLLNCPKGAIRMERGHSVIDPELCVDCGKCKALCPFHAIVRVPVPCEEACPVEAIQRGESGKQVIDHARCIACGRCLQACPFGAVAEPSELVPVLEALGRGERLAALVAPALAGQFEAGLPQVFGALRALGFRVVAEVAAGAEAVADAEAQELAARLEGGESFMTTSCCPAFTALAKVHLKGFADRVSHTPSPLEVTAAQVREAHPECRLVFLSPCLAKRREVLERRAADHVLTFEELGAVLVAKGIEVDRCTPSAPDLGGTPSGRGFAASGGAGAAVLARLPEGQRPVSETVAGLGKEQLKALRPYTVGKGAARFLEVLACEGGCVAGPCSVAPPRLARRRLEAGLDGC